MAKGFRKAKTPTKAEIKNDFQSSINSVTAKVNQLSGFAMQTMQSLRNLDQHVGQISEMARYSETDEVIQENDIAYCDFIGQLPDEADQPGKTFEGGLGLNNAIQIGSKRFIPGFEEKLIGLKKGDILTFKIGFPENYQVEFLKGKEAFFTVEVIKVLKRTDKGHILMLNEALMKKEVEESREKIKVLKEKTLEDAPTPAEESKSN